jgi:hypothetical protein
MLYVLPVKVLFTESWNNHSLFYFFNQQSLNGKKGL